VALRERFLAESASSRILYVPQSGLCIAGLWGIILFHELKGREQIGYWISSVVLIVGATLLTLSK